jgi:predicted transcriptional regulator
MSVNDPELRRLLWFLLGGKRGGENRARIIQTLRVRPRNLNQLANELDLQYKAIQHHVKILVNSSLVIPSGGGYGAVYVLSPWLKYHIEIFDEVCASIGIRNLLKNSHDSV